ncbi:MAG: hypothetical protein QM755_02850 [Luteolibacter sp.]
MASNSDKQFRISIQVDGIEQAKRGFEDFSKTLGSASSSGGSGIVKNVSALAKATEEETVAAKGATEALKGETAALKDNTQAKRENAASGGSSGSGQSADSKAYMADLLAKVKEKVGLEKSAAEEIKKAADARKADVEKLKEAIPLLKDMGAKGQLLEKLYTSGGLGSFARLAGPIAAIAGAVKVASSGVGYMMDKFKEADEEAYNQFKKTHTGIRLLIEPMEVVKEEWQTFKTDIGELRDELMDKVFDGAITAFNKTKEAHELTEKLKKKTQEVKEAREEEEKVFAKNRVRDAINAEVEALKFELEAIEANSHAYERLADLRDSGRELESKRADFADKRALAAGGDMVDIQGNAVLRHLGEGATKLAEQLAASQERFSELLQLARFQGTRATEMGNNPDIPKEETYAALEEARKTYIKVAEAQADTEALTQTLQNKLQMARMDAEGQLDDLQAKVNEKTNEKKEELSDKVTGALDKSYSAITNYIEQGGDTTPGTKTILKTLKKIHDDSTDDLEQTVEVAGALKGLMADNVMTNKEVKKVILESLKSVGEVPALLQEITRQQTITTAQLKAMSAQIQTNSTNLEAVSRQSAWMLNTGVTH